MGRTRHRSITRTSADARAHAHVRYWHKADILSCNDPSERLRLLAAVTLATGPIGAVRPRPADRQSGPECGHCADTQIRQFRRPALRQQITEMFMFLVGAQGLEPWTR